MGGEVCAVAAAVEEGKEVIEGLERGVDGWHYRWGGMVRPTGGGSGGSCLVIFKQTSFFLKKNFTKQTFNSFYTKKTLQFFCGQNFLKNHTKIKIVTKHPINILK